MTKTGTFREGVLVLDDFMEHLLFTSKMPVSDNDWMLLPESGLAAVQNGEIWQEGDGNLSELRSMLKRYPASVRRKKIEQSLHLTRQMGLYNYFRMTFPLIRRIH